MITVCLYVDTQSDGLLTDDSLEDWGRYLFAALPRVGDRFSLWRRRQLAVLEIEGVNQTPIPLEPSELHEPFWPPNYEAPSVHVTARLIGGEMVNFAIERLLGTIKAE